MICRYNTIGVYLLEDGSSNKNIISVLPQTMNPVQQHCIKLQFKIQSYLIERRINYAHISTRGFFKFFLLSHVRIEQESQYLL